MMARTLAEQPAFSSGAGAANRIARLREELRAAEATSFGEDGGSLALGIPAIDDALGGGFVRGALHEIAAACEPESAAATGFALALAARSNDRSLSLQRPLVPARGTPSRLRDGDPVAGTQNLDARLRGHERTSGLSAICSRKTVVWIAEDLSLAENGTLYGLGLDEAGIAPEQLITITVARGRDVLWAMEEALRCRAVGVVIGEMRAHDIDQVATRRLSLAAAAGNALGLFLRTAPNDDHSAAVTRWIIGAAPSASPTGRGRGVGAPRLTARLVRNRRGQLGAWIVEWNSVEQRFELATDSEPMAGPAFDRSHRAAVA
jgi:protein ImuA